MCKFTYYVDKDKFQVIRYVPAHEVFVHMYLLHWLAAYRFRQTYTSVQSCQNFSSSHKLLMFWPLVPLGKSEWMFNSRQGTKLFKYCTCPAGWVAYNFHSSCKHMHMSLKSICNKEHKWVICTTTSLSNFFESTSPAGQVLWEELLVLSRFHS